MKSSLVGLLLSCQFFTSIPIRKQLPMNRNNITAMFMWLPFISLLMGCTVIFFILINDKFLQFSNLLLAVLVVIASIFMTGGLHLDGWIDMSDAYFSYQDQKRRIEILSDSRIGAFGAISLIVIILLKVALIYEVLNDSPIDYLNYFLVIPFLSRIGMMLYFLTMNNVKNEGLAVYFKSNVIHKYLWIALIIYFVLFSLYSIFSVVGLVLILLFISMLLFVLLYRLWTKKNFGGMTGDLLGALYEGTETYLWGILLLILALINT